MANPRGERSSGGDRGGRGGGMDELPPLGGGRRRGGFGRKKVCRFCADNNLKIDYKEPSGLKLFVTERSKIIPRRISGNCAKHQREVGQAIKRSRLLALLPFTVTHA
jgi:small subunit ribosomal protein S18